MTEKKNYPEEIYRISGTHDYHIITSTRKTLEKAYDLGCQHGQQTQGDPLAGWSNLTEAIKAGERIDWEQLDGIEAKCVHPELGALTYKLERDKNYSIKFYTGWSKLCCPGGWAAILGRAWMAEFGWSLWVKGDLPLRKLTADELEPGTIFEAVLTDEEEFGPATLLRVDAGIIDTGDWQTLDSDLPCLEVSRVLGTFQTPEGDA